MPAEARRGPLVAPSEGTASRGAAVRGVARCRKLGLQRGDLSSKGSSRVNRLWSWDEQAPFGNPVSCHRYAKTGCRVGEKFHVFGPASYLADPNIQNKIRDTYTLSKSQTIFNPNEDYELKG